MWGWIFGGIALLFVAVPILLAWRLWGQGKALLGALGDAGEVGGRFADVLGEIGAPAPTNALESGEPRRMSPERGD